MNLEQRVTALEQQQARQRVGHCTRKYTRPTQDELTMKVGFSMSHERLTTEVEVTKEADELGRAVVTLLRVIKQSLADGFQPGQDIPNIWMQSIGALTTGVQGAVNIGNEFKEDPACALRAFSLMATDILELFAPHEH